MNKIEIKKEMEINVVLFKVVKKNDFIRYLEWQAEKIKAFKGCITVLNEFSFAEHGQEGNLTSFFFYNFVKNYAEIKKIRQITAEKVYHELEY